MARFVWVGFGAWLSALSENPLLLNIVQMDRVSTQFPARGKFWFRSPIGVSWSSFVRFLCLRKPLGVGIWLGLMVPGAL